MITDSSPAKKLRKKYIQQMRSHKYGILKLLERDPAWIVPSFSFLSWGQLLLDFKDIQMYLDSIKKEYASNKKFKAAVKADMLKKRLTKEQVDFFLEEITIFYLLVKGKISLSNDYIHHHEKWVLNCYPGNPLECEKFLYRYNLLGLENKHNKFENHQYNLKRKHLINLSV